MNDLKFIRGKFYRDGMEVPLEFGNEEQRRILNNIADLEDGVLWLNDFFKCFCGDIVHKKKRTNVCQTCGNKFKWYHHDDEYGIEDIPCIKLVERIK